MAHSMAEMREYYAYVASVAEPQKTKEEYKDDFDEMMIDYGTKTALKAVKTYLLKTAQALNDQGETQLALVFFLKAEELRAE